MTTPDPDSPPPSADELAGLDPKDLLNAGLESIPLVTQPPQLIDPDATIPVARPQATQPAAPQVELPLPEELTGLLPAGAYQVESFLGQGGMGAVYKGKQVRLKRPVAIKIMRRELGRDMDFEARFEREAQAMAKLNHPGIVSVIDYGEAGPDYLYIVMELVDGADLMDVIRGGQMTQEMALTLLPQICDALQFAHDHGIVHRDIKPSNIMLTRDGRIKMADFGLAKHFDAENSFRTQTGTGMGTPDYAAPEQFDPHGNIDHRADIYALGVMIYQMITGQLPRGVWKPPSQRAEIDPHWDDIVAHAMQSDPSDRYQQASEIKTDVSSISLGARREDGTPAAASGPSLTNRPKAALSGASALTKSRVPFFIGFITTVVVFASAAFFALRQPDPGREAQLAVYSPDNSSSIPDTATSSAPQSERTATVSGIAQANTDFQKELHGDKWQPLVSENEWTREVPGRRTFENGLLHFTNPANKPNYPLSQSGKPFTDGAIRVRMAIKEGSESPSLCARRQKESVYQLLLRPDAKTFVLTRSSLFEPTSEGTLLGQYRLQEPLTEGDKLLMELRAQGDRLSALINGAVVIESRDSGLVEPGDWGIRATNGWFESAEVQPLPSSTTQTIFSEPWVRMWNEPGEYEAAGSLMVVDGWVVRRNDVGQGTRSLSEHWRDGAIRAEFQWAEERKAPSLFLRNFDKNRYTLMRTQDAVQLAYVAGNEKGKTVLKEYPVKAPKAGEIYALELRAVGRTLTAKLDGKEVIRVEDDRLSTGALAIYPSEQGGMRNIEVLNLDAVVPAAAIHTFAGHRYQFVPGEITWDEAQAKAKAMGGHLATITSKEEDKWILETFNDVLWGETGSNVRFWLGGSAAEKDAPWEWVTEEAFSYAHWAADKGAAFTMDSASKTPPFGMIFRRGGVWHGLETRARIVAGFLVEWEDAGAPIVSTSPASATQGVPPAFSSFIPGAVWQKREIESDGSGSRVNDLEKLNNAAIRVRFRAQKQKVNLRLTLRRTEPIGYTPSYIAMFWSEPGPQGTIAVSNGEAVGQYRTIGTYTKRPTLGVGEEHTAELYAIGDRLTAYLDGQPLGSAQDDTFAEGYTAVSSHVGMELISVETADLGVESSASSPTPRR